MNLEREAIVRKLAVKLQVKRADLKKKLQVITENYEQNTKKYEGIPEKDGHEDTLGRIEAASRTLTRRLIDSPDYVKDIIDRNTQIPHFSASLLVVLRQLEDSVKRMPLNRYDLRPDSENEELKHKPQTHRNNLIIDLARLYIEISGKPANLGKDFKHFREQACMYMGIKGKGLFPRHKRLYKLYPEIFK